MHTCLHVQYPLFLSYFNQNWVFFLHIFYKPSNIKFHENPFSVSPDVPRGQTKTEGLTWKLIVAIRNFSDAPKTHVVVCCMNILTSVSNIFWVNSYWRGLTLYLLMLSRRWVPNNASKGQVGFNSAFKGLNAFWPAWRQSGPVTIKSNVGITDNDEWRGSGRKLSYLASLRFMAAQMWGLIDEPYF
jgi:hypothetical protein